MRPSRRSALALVHGAVLLFGLAGVLGKLTPLAPPLIVFGRAVFSGASLAALLAMRRAPLRWRGWRDLAALAASGLLLALHWTAFFAAVQVANVAVALLAFSTFPLFTTALEPLLLHTRPRGVDIAAAALVLPGMYLVVPNLNLGNATTQGAAWGVLAGASFALLSIWNRRLTQRHPSAVISLCQDGAAALVLLPAVIIFRPSPSLVVASLPALLVLGVVCTALAHTLFIEGMRTITAQAASVAAALEPVWGILFALLLLREVPTQRTLLGGVLIVVAVMLPALVRWPGLPHLSDTDHRSANTAVTRAVSPTGARHGGG
jgi:drug/metabolite transporter (DMT)-like permease